MRSSYFLIPLLAVSCSPAPVTDVGSPADVLAFDATQTVDVVSTARPDVERADVDAPVDVREAVDVVESVDAFERDAGVDVVGEDAGVDVVTPLDISGGEAILYDHAGSDVLVVFLPGFQVPSSAYQDFVDALFENHSVLTLDPEGSLFDVSHMRNRDFANAAIDAVASRQHVVVVGHSLGGKVSLMLAAVRSDISAVFAIDPVNGANPITGYSEELPDIVADGTLASVSIPTVVVGELVDSEGSFLSPACAPADENFQTILAQLSNARGFEAVGASHMDFVNDLDECGFNCTVCNDGTADRAQVLSGLQLLVNALIDEQITQTVSPIFATPPAPYVAE